MNQSLRVPFGEREGELFLPSEVVRGKACGCLCPKCKSQLVANQGKKKQPYFSHFGDADCAGGYESSVHAMAKALILESLQITLPAFEHELSATSKDGRTFEERVRVEPKSISFVTANAEVMIGKRRADVVARTASGHDILIEIRVSHAVGEDKLSELTDTNLIEIDLSKLEERDVTDRERFNHIVLNESTREWLACQLYSSEIEATENRLRSRVDDHNQKKEQEAYRAAGRQLEFNRLLAKREMSHKRASELDKTRNAKHQLLFDQLERMMILGEGELRNEELLTASRASLSTPPSSGYSSPFVEAFFSVEGHYDWAFNVHRSVWQQYVCQRWIESSKAGDAIWLEAVAKDCIERFGVLPWLAQLIGLRQCELEDNERHRLYQYDGVWFFPKEVKALIPSYSQLISRFIARLVAYDVLKPSVGPRERFVVITSNLQAALEEHLQLVKDAEEVCPPCHPFQDEEFRLTEAKRILKYRRQRDERISQLLPAVRNFWVRGDRLLKRCDRCGCFQLPEQGDKCTDCGYTRMQSVCLDEEYLRSLPDRLRCLPMELSQLQSAPSKCLRD